MKAKLLFKPGDRVTHIHEPDVPGTITSVNHERGFYIIDWDDATDADVLFNDSVLEAFVEPHLG